MNRNFKELNDIEDKRSSKVAEINRLWTMINRDNYKLSTDLFDQCSTLLLSFIIKPAQWVSFPSLRKQQDHADPCTRAPGNRLLSLHHPHHKVLPHQAASRWRWGVSGSVRQEWEAASHLIEHYWKISLIWSIILNEHLAACWNLPQPNWHKGWSCI